MGVIGSTEWLIESPASATHNTYQNPAVVGKPLVHFVVTGPKQSTTEDEARITHLHTRN